MTAFLVGGVAFGGLLVGSFLNVVAYRVPAGISLLHPPSRCPHCETEILWRDNVPVVGWLVLRGRCRHCSAPISPRYPIVEAATAALFAGTAALIGALWVLPAYLWFVGLTIVLVLTDLDLKRIPNAILYPGTVVALVLLGIGAVADGDLPALGRALGGGAAVFGLLLVVALLARGAFGFGDVKLGFLLGVFTGFRGWGSPAVAVFSAFLIGGLVSMMLLATRRAGRRDAIPFGPSLVAGAYVAVVWGEDLASWYLG